MIPVIYALCDPDTGEARYVGKSVRPYRRFDAHLRDAGKRTHKGHWIKSLLVQGKKPVLTVLEEVTHETWEERERAWIAKLPNLTNTLSGGDGLTSEYLRTVAHTPEWNAKVAASKRGKPRSAETRAKLSKALTGLKRGPCSIETRAKISKAHMGMGHSPETCAKISALKRALPPGRREQGRFVKRGE